MNESEIHRIICISDFIASIVNSFKSKFISKYMYRGIIKFVCNDCGNKFKAPDIEWGATIYSVPQPCPKCGGMHTRPDRSLNFLVLLDYFTYKRLWKEIDKNKRSE